MISNNLTNWYFTKKAAPYWVIVLLDCFFYYAVWIFTYAFFIGFRPTMHMFLPLVGTLTIFLIPQLVFFKIFHTYSVIVRYSSFVDLLRIVYAVFFGSVVAFGLHYLTNIVPNTILADTRGVQIFIAGVGLAFVMLSVRVVVKYLYDMVFQTEDTPKAFIYGVQEGGIGLAKKIRTEKPARFSIKGFISHDPGYNNTHLLGENVYMSDKHIIDILKKNKIKAVLVSPLQKERFRRDTKLQDYIMASGAKIYMSTYEREWDPKAKPEISSLKEVDIVDLLPRDQISVDLNSIGALLTGKRILVTGSAGSIGSEMVRQIAEFKPASMMLLDQAETPQHDIRLQLAKYFPNIEVHTIVTSICHPGRMEKIFSTFKPDYVFHAAAYKHVPMMENNPTEAVLNNILGTKIIADLSVKYGVKKFVMISSDKAVNPTNVMGCSKRICEIYVQSLNLAQESGSVKGETQFVTTRFGNVLGSNGSVIPLFKQQIQMGGPVTVTDKNVVRFFMLIPEACKLVLEAGAKGNGGEIFVFDMGEPVKIVDLAKRMINLSGAKNIEIKFTGLREGEKMYEEVLSSTENTLPSFHEKIRIAKVRSIDYPTASKQIDELIETANHYDSMSIVKKLKEIVPEFISNNSVYTVLDKK